METIHRDGTNQKQGDISGMIGISSRFATINKLITRDLNQYRSRPAFAKYSKDDITKYLSDPAHHQNQLRMATQYLYGASSHFRRLIQYFVSLSDLSYVVSPYHIDPRTANKSAINKKYRRVINALSAMSIRTQFPKILTVCLREDVFFGTMWVSDDSIIIQQLPSQYCSIQSVEANVPNASFDFRYFDRFPTLLDYYPAEFRLKYEQQYKKDRSRPWIELDAPTSFAIKCNNDILDYAVPPFAGILREVYDIENYKDLKLTKTAIENYAMVVMTLGTNDEGGWAIDYDKAVDFWRNLDAVLPEEIGSILTPMPVSKISFEKSNTGDTNTVADAEQNLFSAAGVSSLLFNNDKASANALSLSIKADQAITYGIVKSLEDMVNRFIQYQNYGKNFKVTFLDVSPFNRKEMGDQYLKACQYGVPMLSYYCASQGLSQSEMDCMNFLENDVLGLAERFKPLQSSATQSASTESKGATDEGGAPEKDIDELSESGEQNREDA